MAGGADVILIPEIPFHYESVCEAIMEREKKGKHFTLIVAAEGAKPAGGDYVTSGGQQQNREARLGGISAVVAAEVEKRTGKETRVIVLGHLQRGGSPTYMDRVLCTLFGAKAVELITEGRFGRMVAHNGKFVESVPLAEATSRLRTVPLDEGFVHATRSLGICLGD
jgi:6-phosphofructokinase 1